MSQEFTDMIYGAMARINSERKASAANMRLGQFIEALAACEPSLPVVLEDGRGVHGFQSYRGYYEDLSIQPREMSKDVVEVLAEARACLGECFEGYKGGDFYMSKDSLLWVARYGETGGNMVTGIRPEATRVVIETTLHDDYK